MPLIVVSGLPSSGKSGAAAALADVCRALGQDVVVVDEESLHLRRNDSYKDATSEKVARGTLLSAVERSLTRRRTVICDSQNNIKGYRYQLWCIARQAATRYCMVHVDTPADVCREWNAARPAEGAFSDAIFEDLACRFERPDSRNRWDAPLFTLRPQLGRDAMQETLEAAAAAVADAPAPQRGAAAPAAAAAGGGGAAAAAAAAADEESGSLDGPAPLLQAKQLKPKSATDTPMLAATNLQYEIDKALQQVLDRVGEAQAAAGSGAPGRVTFEGCSSSAGEPLPELDMYRPMFLPELRRHKRAFMKLATQQTFLRLRDAAAAQRLFVDYLKDQLAVGG
ncbi:hypothetical protein COHA_002803 [Chlorella ohadii]|uniref:KTI12-like protein n=1 Tax=Chlorella ohadii TaxID=2649997 RepID=A0AAD5H4I5_9CHLO|nr:hypothetical protein COHA_002803 [Chlorella ohadii]